MNGVAGWLALALHAALFTAAAPVAVGLLRWMAARLAGHAGPSPLQPWRDLRRLVRKQPVMAEGASWFTLAAPVLAIMARGAAALLVPSFTFGMASAPVADLVLLAGLLALARGVMALAGMDTGTAVGGMGAGRLMRPAWLGEPALLLVVLVFAVLAGTTNLDAIAAVVREAAGGPPLAVLLVLPAAVTVALVQTGLLLPVRGVDELAMQRAAVAQDFSGWALALVEAAEAAGLLLWLGLLGALFLPFGIAAAGAGPAAWLAGLAAWAAKTLAMLAVLAVFEASRARMRASAVTQVLAAAVVLGLVAAVLLFAGPGGA